jgi:hypothetical protein
MGLSKFETYSVTPRTLGSSKLSIWSVSLKTNPLPCSLPTTRADSARAGSGAEAVANSKTGSDREVASKAAPRRRAAVSGIRGGVHPLRAPDAGTAARRRELSASS